MLSDQSMVMRWEKVHQRIAGGGPGKRWGHTCNAIRGGKLLYVFGGYGEDQCQTNRVHVFDTVNMLWSEPVMKGIPPVPRDSHSCTTVGDNLFVFGGTDGRKPLNDLIILDTASNTWISPSLRGNGPEAREGHSAALIGKRLFIFGGCGKSVNNEIYYDDLYILNTETFSWKRVVPSGTPPSKRDSHTCSSWKDKIIVIGGEDSSNYYLPDVHILDADSLVWCKLNTTGHLLPPRAGHTTISFGDNLFVFGGFSDEQNLYDDVHVLDLEKGMWTKVAAAGEGPSARFSMAGESLDPQMAGVLMFIGGCNKNLEALNDIYFLHTGLSRDVGRDARRTEKLSLRKQLKLKCQENIHSPSRVEHDTTIYQATPISSYTPPGRHNYYISEYQINGKRTFQAKVTKSDHDNYIIETVIDGRVLRGLLFGNKPISNGTVTDSSDRTTNGADVEMQNDGANVHGNPNSAVDSEISTVNGAYDAKPEVDAPKEDRASETMVEAEASVIMNQSAGKAEVTGSEMEKPEAVPQVEVAASDIKNTACTESSVQPELDHPVEVAAPEIKNPASDMDSHFILDGPLEEVAAVKMKPEAVPQVASAGSEIKDPESAQPLVQPEVSGSFELFPPPQEGAGDNVTTPFSVADILEENGVADFEIQSNPLD